MGVRGFVAGGLLLVSLTGLHAEPVRFICKGDIGGSSAGKDRWKFEDSLSVDLASRLVLPPRESSHIPITLIEDTQVVFEGKATNGMSVGGHMNRVTGELFAYWADSRRITKTMLAECRPASRLF